ncbi:hypothetical protein PAF17_03620 [Paracoccus sp. Z330]|uniref:Uncharacterized protein n=1 Tax=Paracoccus onchidii TaxID=3017813 RepID=A0ABT4ZB48_9RHOB|nr:hypothetical protein [Paracoccus onchidii]MDB6176590.1 hypothetical protein [Paracoccus onchidii]
MGKRFRYLADLTPVQLAHYDVALSFGREFSRSEYFSRYKQIYPDLNAEGTILPTDFCWNNEQKAKCDFPSFMEIVDRGVYRFVGLQEGEALKRRGMSPGSS